MKETTTRKTIMKQSKDLKQAPLGVLKSAMAAPRKPQIKESFNPRLTSHRYTELPSLRYGATPNQNSIHHRESGPLKVCVSYENNFAKKKGIICGKGSGRCAPSVGVARSLTGSNLPFCNGEAPPSVRRVHFAELPPKSNSFAGNSVSLSSRFERHGIPVSFCSSAKANGLRLGNNGNLRGTTVLTNPAVHKALRGHDTATYRQGTLTHPTTSLASGILRAAKDGDDDELAETLRKANLFGISAEELNAADNSGRTALSYIASNGTLSNLKAILQLPKIDVNKQDNEGNTPLHFAAQAGQVEAINYMLSVCTNLEVDARNALGFTPLMKAALQGRTKCAKLLLFAGASPTLRDSGRGLRAEQWAKYCGRYVCAEVIEKFTKHKLLDRNTTYGRWGSEPEIAEKLATVKSSPTMPIQNASSIKTKLRKAFRTMSHPGSDTYPKPFSVVSQLTSAALCASSPVLQSSVSPSVKSLMRPLSVPKVQVTLASNCSYGEDTENYQHSSESGTKEKSKNKKKK